ncbi:MAG TPA: cytochrome c [Polyangia bacterium]|nr:cytochrome c [Polyangia bacterium]
MRTTLLALAVLACGCAPPIKNVPMAEIPKLTKLDDVMDVQATLADPQFKKIGAASYSDADWAAFADAAERIGATSAKIKDFSKGAGFDALAMQLKDKAAALGTAASAKDASAASRALAEMKATCKECHSKFR